jgi:hypothetical protein
MKLRWHFPGYIDVDDEDRKEIEFQRVEEFYILPRIVDLSRSAKFSRWSVSEECLMMECGFWARNDWVFAYLSEDAIAALNLPRWRGDGNLFSRFARMLP